MGFLDRIKGQKPPETKRALSRKPSAAGLSRQLKGAAEGEPPPGDYKSWQTFLQSRKRRMQSDDEPVGVVSAGFEFHRIKDLPRRPFDPSFYDMALPWVKRTPDSTMHLKPIQSAALAEAAAMDGLLAGIAVGAGKTLITLLLPQVMRSRKAVLLVPAKLANKTRRDAQFYAEHFELPLEILHLHTYHELSDPEKGNFLEEEEPDLIIADEAHKLRRPQSTRTKRFLRYMREYPGTRFCALSGTLTSRSLKDYAHLSELALRKHSPVPHWEKAYFELSEWCYALDATTEKKYDPGCLMEFCKPREPVRSGFRRRLVETPGVIMSTEGSLGASLYIKKRVVSVPDKIMRLYNKIQKTWSLGEEEFKDAMHLAAALKQVSCGFYYRWIWPNGERDVEWLDARAAWHKAIRQRMKHARKGMDSPKLLENAAERWRTGYKGEKPIWACPEYLQWCAVRDRYTPEPPKETVWLDSFLILDVMRRIDESEPTIIWYQHLAVGQKLAEATRYEHFGAGDDAELATTDTIICSVDSQGTGRNLQHRFARNVFTTLPANGTTVEQTLGRTHRDGQKADAVWAEWYGHTEVLDNAMAAAIRDAQYQQETQGIPQKLLYASRL